ncbi:hypothetical protein [Corynebacterium striatum]|uniref:hypothetical protein n=1 Tax=Corynebacterium striatum TaxID=43770 RepID=UPI003B63FA1F
MDEKFILARGEYGGHFLLDTETVSIVELTIEAAGLLTGAVEPRTKEQQDFRDSFGFRDV